MLAAQPLRPNLVLLIQVGSAWAFQDENPILWKLVLVFVLSGSICILPVPESTPVSIRPLGTTQPTRRLGVRLWLQ